jgi:hypothetical protein
MDFHYNLFMFYSPGSGFRCKSHKDGANWSNLELQIPVRLGGMLNHIQNHHLLLSSLFLFFSFCNKPQKKDLVEIMLCNFVTLSLFLKMSKELGGGGRDVVGAS